MTLTEKFYYRPVPHVIPIISLLSNGFNILIGVVVKLKLEHGEF